VVKLPVTEFLADPVTMTNVLGWTALAMVISLGLQFVMVVTQKVRVETAHAAEDHAFARFKKLLAGGISLAALPFNPLVAAERRALAHALTAFPPAGGEMELLATPWCQPLLHILRKETRHHHWGRRASAYETLGLLPTRAVRELLLAAAGREQQSRAFAACIQALALHADTDAEIQEVVKLLDQRHVLSGSFNLGIFHALIERICRGDDMALTVRRIQRLLVSLDKSPLLLLDAVQAVGSAGPTKTIPTLVAIVNRPGARVELRVACTRAISKLDGTHPSMVAALDDPSWMVQAAAARGVRRNCSATLVRLVRLLTHPNFHVRRNAAMTLSQLGEVGSSVLRAAARSSDRYAADLARYTLGQQATVNA
jgi:hypothetical protein